MRHFYIKRFFSSAAAFILAFSFFCRSSYAAHPSFSDVDSTHWAYPSIVRIAEFGILVGDTEGKYFPDKFIDKFETAKILARISGYKQLDYTESEKSFYDGIYEKNRLYLSQYSQKYKKWNTTADRQIAFLLEKEILTPDDLKDFVGIRPDGTEGIRALTKESAASFVVKALGKKSEAASLAVTETYSDDLKISVAARPYVYYLKSAGVMSGDVKNNFAPHEAITRAGMAKLLDLSFTYTGFDPKGVSDSSGANPAGATLQSVTGAFAAFYESNNIQGIQLVLPGGAKKIYKISGALTISIDGTASNKQDLREGTVVNAVISDNEITDIKADTTQTLTAVPAESNAPEPDDDVKPEPERKTGTEGIVSEIFITASGASVTITDEQGGNKASYKIIPGSIDVYSLRIGSRVILNLSSNEAELVQIVSAGSAR